MASEILQEGSPDPNAEQSPPLYGDPDTPTGPLMGDISTPEGQKKVARANIKLWEAKDDWIKRDLCQWKVNAARRMGVAHAKVIWNNLDDTWDTWFPENVSPDGTPNDRKLATTERRMTSAMFTDPPAPLVEPPSGDDEDEDAAEHAERILTDLQSESNLGTQHALREAFDKAHDFASGFVHYLADDHAGGKLPMSVEASVEQMAPAMTADETLMEINPRTGLPWQGPFVERFVRPDGSLTDDEAEAATIWMRKLKREILTGRNVRPIPHTAKDISECDGIQVGLFLPWGAVSKLKLHDGTPVGQLPKEERSKVLQYRPEHAKDLVPAHIDVEEDFDDIEAERLCFVLRTYYEQCPDYPDGLHLLTLADCYVLHRESWIDDTDGVKRKALIPVTQVKQWSEGRDNFYGVGTGEFLGSQHEIRYVQVEAWLDHLERFNRPHVFYPDGSGLRPEHFQQRRGVALPYRANTGTPFVEQVPEFSRSAQEMYVEQGSQMDLAAGLNDQPIKDSESGRQAYALLAQSHAGLSEPRQNIERAYTRACRIELQMARMFLTQPQLMKFESEGGRYKRKRWLGSDLLATYDIRIKPGTMTMLSPAGKAQFIEHYMGLGIMSPDEAKERLTSGVGALLGWRDDEFRMRIRGQIAEWSEGPPEGWAPPQPQPMVMAGPMGPQIVQQPPPPDPFLARMWAPVPSDTLPNVAQIRLDQLARLMQKPQYQRFPPEWRMPVDMEYQRMMQTVQMAQAAAQPQAPPDARQAAQKKSTPTKEQATADKVREGVPPEMAA